MLYRSIVVVLFISGALLAAHLIASLPFRTTEHDKATEAPAPLPAPETASINYEQLAEEILASQVFDSPPKLSPNSAGEGAQGGSSGGLGGAKPDEPPIDAASKIRLIGTAAGPKPLGRAVVEDINTRKQSLYHLYDLVPNVGEIVEIRQESILIRRGRKEEVLELQNIKHMPSQSGESNPAAAELPAPAMN